MVPGADTFVRAPGVRTRLVQPLSRYRRVSEALDDPECSQEPSETAMVVSTGDGSLELDLIGALVFERLSDGFFVERIAAELAQRFPVDPAAALRDVRMLVQEFIGLGVVIPG